MKLNKHMSDLKLIWDNNVLEKRRKQFAMATNLNKSSLLTMNEYFLVRRTAGVFSFVGNAHKIKGRFNHVYPEIKDAMNIHNNHLIIVMPKKSLKKFYGRKPAKMPFFGLGRPGGSSDRYGTETVVLTNGDEELKRAINIHCKFDEYERHSLNLKKLHIYSRVKWEYWLPCIGLLLFFTKGVAHSEAGAS